MDQIVIQDTFEVPGLRKQGEFLIDANGNSELRIDRETHVGMNIHALDFMDGFGKDREHER